MIFCAVMIAHNGRHADGVAEKNRHVYEVDVH